MGAAASAAEVALCRVRRAPTKPPAPPPSPPPLGKTLAVRVVTYNVLTPGYAAEHVVASPGCLAPGARLSMLQQKLLPEVARHSVLCLQELSLGWAGHLGAWLSDMGYHLVSAQYSRPNSLYMGVAIAYPRNWYMLEEARMQRVGDFKPRPSSGEPPVAPWPLVRARENQMVSVRLRPCVGGREGGREFTVSNYHMPCVWMDGRFMRAHAALAAQAARAFAAGLPYVLAGDFNFTPETPAYAMMTRGSAERDEPPPEAPGDGWACEVRPPLRSACAVALGREPAFTTLSLKRSDAAQGGKPFGDTLDYVFLSPEWAVEGVAGVSEGELGALRERGGGTMPFPGEPSDHAMIAVQLQLGHE